MTTQTIVEHRKCICVEFGDTNNNKYWQYTLYDDGTALTEWGRVGKKAGKMQVPHSKALKKWKEKTRSTNKPDKLYTEVKSTGTGGSTDSGSSIKKAQLADVAKKQIKHNNPIVQNLIDYLVTVNAHNIAIATGGSILYDESSAQFKTPLGIIDPSMVQDARLLLSDMATFVQDSNYSSPVFMRKLNQYLRNIPHDVGMKKITPELIFPDFSYIQQENDLLEGLEAGFADIITNGTKTKKKSAPKVFDVQLELVADKKIISWARKLYQSTRKAMHRSNNLSVDKIYKVDISNMRKAFERKGGKMTDIRQLWHGTKDSNLLSILRKGLIIPPSSSVHCTGRMYGNGLYFSCISTKALNYAGGYAPGQSRHSSNRKFMFIADVAMGTPYIAGGGWGSYPKKGYDSTWAKGGQSGVVNDEMIVYNLDQANLVYLIEFIERK